MSPFILMLTAGAGIALLPFLVLKYKFQPFVALMLVSILVALVAAGQGVVLLPSVVARGLVRPGVVRVKLLAPDYLRWDIAFIWRRGAYLSKAAQAWLALLRERGISP